jgi:hypothetical protein
MRAKGAKEAVKGRIWLRLAALASFELPGTIL